DLFLGPRKLSQFLAVSKDWIQSLASFGRTAAGVALAAGLLAACSGNKEQEYVEREVGTIYNLAGNYLDDRQYRFAAAYFDEVERQHPYSAWARRAQLMAAYSYYMSNKYEDAI